MNTLAYLGFFATISGLVFYFSSSAFSTLGASLNVMFETLGTIMIYVGIVFILCSLVSSTDVFFEGAGKKNHR